MLIDRVKDTLSDIKSKSKRNSDDVEWNKIKSIPEVEPITSHTSYNSNNHDENNEPDRPKTRRNLPCCSKQEDVEDKFKTTLNKDPKEDTLEVKDSYDVLQAKLNTIIEQEAESDISGTESKGTEDEKDTDKTVDADQEEVIKPQESSNTQTVKLVDDSALEQPIGGRSKESKLKEIIILHESNDHNDGMAILYESIAAQTGFETASVGIQVPSVMIDARTNSVATQISKMINYTISTQTDKTAKKFCMDSTCIVEIPPSKNNEVDKVSRLSVQHLPPIVIKGRLVVQRVLKFYIDPSGRTHFVPQHKATNVRFCEMYHNQANLKIRFDGQRQEWKRSGSSELSLLMTKKALERPNRSLMHTSVSDGELIVLRKQQLKKFIQPKPDILETPSKELILKSFHIYDNPNFHDPGDPKLPFQVSSIDSFVYKTYINPDGLPNSGSQSRPFNLVTPATLQKISQHKEQFKNQQLFSTEKKAGSNSPNKNKMSTKAGDYGFPNKTKKNVVPPNTQLSTQKDEVQEMQDMILQNVEEDIQKKEQEKVHVEIQEKVQEEIKQKVPQETQDEIQKEVQEEIPKEAQEEIQKEVQEEVQEEVQKEAQKETQKEVEEVNEVYTTNLVKTASSQITIPLNAYELGFYAAKATQVDMPVVAEPPQEIREKATEKLPSIKSAKFSRLNKANSSYDKISITVSYTTDETVSSDSLSTDPRIHRTSDYIQKHEREINTVEPISDQVTFDSKPTYSHRDSQETFHILKEKFAKEGYREEVSDMEQLCDEASETSSLSMGSTIPEFIVGLTESTTPDLKKILPHIRKNVTESTDKSSRQQLLPIVTSSYDRELKRVSSKDYRRIGGGSIEDRRKKSPKRKKDYTIMSMQIHGDGIRNNSPSIKPHLKIGKNGRYKDEENLFCETCPPLDSVPWRRKFVKTLPRYNYKSKYTLDTSSYDAASVEPSLSEGEVKCHSSASIGEVRKRTRSDLSNKIQQNAMLKDHGPESNIIRERRTYFNHWVTYYINKNKYRSFVNNSSATNST